MSQREHLFSFDRLRLLAAVCVVYMHTAAGLLRADTVDFHWHGANLLTSLAFTAVPLFFMMSGYLLLRDPRTADVSLLLKKRLPRLLVPLLCWTVLVILWQMHLEDDFTAANGLDKLLLALRQPASVHLWYLYALTGLYALTPLLHLGLNALNPTGHKAVLTVIGLIQLKTVVQTFLPAELDVYLELDLLNRLNFFDGNLATFVLGWYLGRWERKLPKGALLGGMAALLVVIAGGTWYHKIHLGYYAQHFHNQQTGWMILLAALLFLYAKQNWHKPVGLSSAVPLTLGIYLMQSLLLEVLLAFGLTVNTFWDTLWVSALVLVLCWLALKTAASIRPLCYALTGQRWDDACRTCNWQHTLKK